MERPASKLSFSGVLDISRYRDVAESFKEAPAGSRVIVDLTRVTSIDSTFMGELMLFNRRMAKEGRSVVVVAKGEVARTLVVAGIDKRIPIVSDPDAATLLA